MLIVKLLFIPFSPAIRTELFSRFYINGSVWILQLPWSTFLPVVSGNESLFYSTLLQSFFPRGIQTKQNCIWNWCVGLGDFFWLWDFCCLVGCFHSFNSPTTHAGNFCKTDPSLKHGPFTVPLTPQYLHWKSLNLIALHALPLKIQFFHR